MNMNMNMNVNMNKNVGVSMSVNMTRIADTWSHMTKHDHGATRYERER